MLLLKLDNFIQSFDYALEFSLVFHTVFHKLNYNYYLYFISDDDNIEDLMYVNANYIDIL